jgi:hypothetical protein
MTKLFKELSARFGCLLPLLSVVLWSGGTTLGQTPGEKTLQDALQDSANRGAEKDPEELARSQEYVKQQNRQMVEALQLDPMRLVAQNPNEVVPVSAYEWNVLRAQVALLTFPRYLDICRYAMDTFQFSPLVHPGEDRSGYFFWDFWCEPNVDDETIAMIASVALFRVKIMNESHPNAHCFVFHVTRNNEEGARYATFDTNERGELLPVLISNSPPRPTTERRNAVARAFEELRAVDKEIEQLVAGKANEDFDPFSQMNRLLERRGELLFRTTSVRSPGTDSHGNPRTPR